MRPTMPRPALAAAGLVLVALAGCTASTPSATAVPTPTPASTARPTPTPVAVEVTSPAEAAALVIATDPLFAGARELDPSVIGASKWWEATPLAGGGYLVTVAIGWGDCPAGCIERHAWEFEVGPDGVVELVGETGPPVPPDVR